MGAGAANAVVMSAEVRGNWRSLARISGVRPHAPACDGSGPV